MCVFYIHHGLPCLPELCHFVLVCNQPCAVISLLKDIQDVLYEPLSDDKNGCIKAILDARQVGHTFHMLDLVTHSYEDPREIPNEPQDQQAPMPFMGPWITLQTTCGKHHMSSFAEADLLSFP
jgi:hypothetical protein